MLFLDVHLELVGVLELLGALPAADPLAVVLRVEVHLQRLLRLEHLLAEAGWQFNKIKEGPKMVQYGPKETQKEFINNLNVRADS